MPPRKIPGFAPHGTRYRAPVSLSEADADDVAKEATARGVPVSIVLMERVRRQGNISPAPDQRAAETMDNDYPPPNRAGCWHCDGCDRCVSCEGHGPDCEAE